VANRMGQDVTASEVLAVAGNETHYGEGFANFGNYFGLHGVGPAGTYRTTGKNHQEVQMFPVRYGFLMSGLEFAQNLTPYLPAGVGSDPAQFFQIVHEHGYATPNANYAQYMTQTGATRGPYTLIIACMNKQTSGGGG